MASDRKSMADSPSAAFVNSQAHLLKATSDNPLPTAVPPPIAATAGTLGVRHVLCLIGLPERGKPFIARRLDGYLSFFHGAQVKRFNINDYVVDDPGSDTNADKLHQDLRKFMMGNDETSARNMDSLTNELHIDENDRRRKNVDSGKVAIVYATESHSAFKEKWAGTSKERRRWMADTLRLDTEVGAKLIFIEVIVDKPDIIEANIIAKRKSQGELSPVTPAVMRDYKKRLSAYSKLYVTLQDDGSEDDLSYIKLYNYGHKVVTNRMHGYLRMRIAQFLTTIHTTPHVIYLSRHGQSEYNVLGKIGGNPPLSAAGAEYARRLGEWVPRNIMLQDGKVVRARLWTSSLQRTILTAAHIPHPLVLHSELGAAPRDDGGECGIGSILELSDEHSAKLGAGLARVPSYDAMGSPCRGMMPPETPPAEGEGGEVWEQMSPRVYRNLDEIFAGEYEGMTYEEIKAKAPDEASLRSMDKIGYRYPRGESYFDILARLDPLVHEMESYHEPLLLVSHQAVLRVLYCYLMGKPRTSAPKLEIPLHSVMKITYDGWNPPSEERVWLGPKPPEPSDDGQKNL